MPIHKLHLGKFWRVFAVVFCILGTVLSARSATVTVYGNQTNQVIDGFGVNINSWSWSTNEIAPLLDAFIDEAGMTLFRVVVRNGLESTNDNEDASVPNWSYYNALYSSPEFEKLWGIMGYLNQKGITNGAMINPQGIGPEWLGSDILTPGLEDEWAEMIATMLVYARNTRQIGFKLVAPHNEPDSLPEGISIPTASQYVTTLHKLAELLDTNGLSDVRFVGPDRAGGSTTFLPEMMNDPLVIAKVAHFGVHSYSDQGSGSVDVRDFINLSGFPDRTLWVTEFNVWCPQCVGGSATNDWDYSRATAEYLLDHLGVGASAGLVWEGYDSYYPHDGFWTLFGLFTVNDTNAVPLTFTRAKGFYTVAQISKFVPPSAQNVNYSGFVFPMRLQTFFHKTSGRLSLTGVNPSDATTLDVTLTGLPSIPALELYCTTATTNLALLATIPVSNRTFTATIPADCVFTLTGVEPSLPPPLLSASLQTNIIVISWPDYALNYVLESTTNLAAPQVWLTVTNFPQSVSNRLTTPISPTGLQQFFRLKKL